MRTYSRAFADLWVVILIKIPKGLYDITHFATKVRVFIMVELVYIIPFSRRCMFKVLVDISIYIFSKGSFVWNAAFCVKCGLIADHFSSLGRMRTKSAIAAFYGPTGCISQSPWQFWSCDKEQPLDRFNTDSTRRSPYYLLYMNNTTCL